MRNDLQSLIDTELAFAQTSKEKGIRHAFLKFLADEAIVFNPEPVKGKPIFANKKNDSGLLNWKPVFADISLSGDLGYTTGPYEYQKERKKKKTDGYGHYVSIWKKQPDGKWRVALDAGIYHAAHKLKMAEFTSPKHPKTGHAKSWEKVDVKQEQDKLLELERKISDISIAGKIVDAIESYYADKIRFYRNDEFPVLGKRDVLSKLSAEKYTMTLLPLKAIVAKSGDLGYTYGMIELKTTKSEAEILQKYSYLKIWKKQVDGKWKTVLDLTNPIPESEKLHDN